MTSEVEKMEIINPAQTKLYSLRVSVSPGLENLLSRELTTLGIVGTQKTIPGGILFEGPRISMWNIILRSRIAEDVYIKLGEPFDATDARKYHLGLHQLPWEEFYFFSPSLEEPLVKITSTNSRLHNENLLRTEFYEMYRERLKHAMKKQLDKPKTRDTLKGYGSRKPSVVKINIMDNICHVEIQASDPMGERDWVSNNLSHLFIEETKKSNHDKYNAAIDSTPESVPAKRPSVYSSSFFLRPTIAASCILRTTFLKNLSLNEKVCVWDPFCGGGSILLETEFPSFSTKDYYSALSSMPLQAHPKIENLMLLGSDMRLEAIEASKENLALLTKNAARTEEIIASRESPISSRISFIHSNWKDLVSKVPSPFLVTCMPLSLRETRNDKEAMKDHIRNFSKLVKARSDWKGVYVVNTQKNFQSLTGLEWQPLLRFSMRGVSTEFLRWTGNLAKKIV